MNAARTTLRTSEERSSSACIKPREAACRPSLQGDGMGNIITFSISGYQVGDLQLFHDVTDARLAQLLADCPVIEVAAGQPISNTHGKRACLYIVLRGAIGASQQGTQPEGIGETMTKVLPGECAGELSVLDEEANSSLMSALEDSVLLVIEADRLWKLIDEFNGVARNLLRLLSFRIRAANAQIRRRQKVGEFYRQLSMVDGLTGLQNRAWLNDHLSKLIDNAHAAGNPLSIIMIDLDHFKRFNDEYGHLAGDNALQTAAGVLTEALRPRDFAARYGGEELMVILPNTHRNAGLAVAQRLCERMRQSIVFSDASKPLPHITASFGVAALSPGQDADALISVADAALYRAKEAGRNQVSQ